MSLRLMLVDDHAIVRHAIVEMIRTHTAWTVVAEFEDGAALLRRLATEQPDVVVLDLHMPGVSGPELIERLQQDHPTIAIVVLSMADEASLVRRTLTAGARAYVLKASDFQVLSSAIEAVNRGQTFVDPALLTTLLRPIEPSQPGDPHPADVLSRREMQVFELLAQGLSPTDIADRLFVSIKTVSTHKANLMQKLGLHTALDLFQYARRHGFTSG